MRSYTLLLLLFATALVICEPTIQIADGSVTEASHYTGYDGTAYSYETYGNGIDDEYRCTIDSAVVSTDVLFVAATLEGYPVTQISQGAFAGNTTIRVVVIPYDVTFIGVGAFAGCSSLTAVYFLGNRPEIGADAIPESTELLCKEGASGWSDTGRMTMLSASSADGSAVDAVVIDGTAVIIGGTPNTLGNVTVPDIINGYVVDTIGSYAFAGSKESPRADVTSVVIEAQLKGLRERAFYCCTGLADITLPSSLAFVGDEAFRMDTALTGMGLPQAVAFIGFEAYRDCRSLTVIDVPDSVTFLGGGAFYICSGVTEATIGAELSGVSEREFGYCSSLRTVSFSSSVGYVGHNAFYMCRSLSEIDLHGCFSIGDGAFFGCESLLHPDFGDVLTEIGSSAFSGCLLFDRLRLPDTVVSVGANAFAYCDSLHDISFSGDMPVFGADVFLGDDVTVHCTTAHQASWASFSGRLTVDGKVGSAEDCTAGVIAAVAVVSALSLAFIIVRKRRKAQ
jgi:hypothetical protein